MGDDDWPAVAGNLAKARKSWGRLQGILSREGATKRVSGKFFKAIVQQVLLFGAETWVDSGRQAPPTIPGLCQVPRYCRPVVITLRQDPPQAFKPRDRLYLLSVDLEGHLRTVPDLRLRHSPSLPVRPNPAHLCALVAAIEGPPRYEHVTICASGMGGVSLLKDDNYVLHVPPP